MRRPTNQRLAPLPSPEALLRRRGTTVPATVRRISSLRSIRRRASERPAPALLARRSFRCFQAPDNGAKRVSTTVFKCRLPM